MWCSDHSPHSTNALASRISIAIIPSSRYVFEPTGRNLTIQTALDAIVRSFNHLSTLGVSLHDPISKEVVASTKFVTKLYICYCFMGSGKILEFYFFKTQVVQHYWYVMGIRGDWKAFKQLLALTRDQSKNEVWFLFFFFLCFLVTYIYQHMLIDHACVFPTSLQVCWMCHATKGQNNDLSMAYTNSCCNWKDTLYQTLPFDQPYPILTSLVGWELGMVHPDLLHCWHLGVGRDFLASALVFILKNRLIFPGRNLKARLACATRSLVAFAKTKKLHLSRKSLNKQCLNWVPREYPELKFKGADVYITGMWLAELVQDNDAGIPSDLCTCLWLSNNILSLMANSKGYFMTPDESEQLLVLGELFNKLYLKLAQKALEDGAKLYRTRPKYHLLQHVFCTRKVSGLNLHRYATWPDEDANRKFMKVNRASHRATASTRVLQRWLLGLPRTFARLE